MIRRTRWWLWRLLLPPCRRCLRRSHVLAVHSVAEPWAGCSGHLGRTWGGLPCGCACQGDLTISRT